MRYRSACMLWDRPNMDCRHTHTSPPHISYLPSDLITSCTTLPQSLGCWDACIACIKWQMVRQLDLGHDAPYPTQSTTDVRLRPRYLFVKCLFRSRTSHLQTATMSKHRIPQDEGLDRSAIELHHFLCAGTTREASTSAWDGPHYC